MNSTTEMLRGETVPQFYRRLTARARNLEPSVVAKNCEPGEVMRMRDLVEQLEKQAERKAEEERRNDPRNIAISPPSAFRM